MITGYKEKSEYVSKNGITSTVYLMDCMEGMKGYADNHFDLAVVDPPYGIDINSSGRLGHYGGKGKKWDANIPEETYFNELFRVSKNQIIWGGNYFYLPPTRCFLIWDKQQPEDVSFASCEFAWTSLNESAKTFYKRPQNADIQRIHPTQKPVALYDWIFNKYAKPIDIILDTHLGSGSSRIAAERAGLNFMGFELDADYYHAQEKRFKNHVSQLTLFLLLYVL
jgi:site-specific DNA-methyltransferase (adenine-specific)